MGPVKAHATTTARASRNARELPTVSAIRWANFRNFSFIRHLSRLQSTFPRSTPARREVAGVKAGSSLDRAGRSRLKQDCANVPQTQATRSPRDVDERRLGTSVTFA